MNYEETTYKFDHHEINRLCRMEQEQEEGPFICKDELYDTLLAEADEQWRYNNTKELLNNLWDANILPLADKNVVKIILSYDEQREILKKRRARANHS